MALDAKLHLTRIATLERRVSELQCELEAVQNGSQQRSAPADQRRLDSEQRFRTLATHAPMGIFQIDLAGNLLYANDRFRAIAGIAAGENEAEHCSRALHPDDVELVHAAWQRAIEDQGEFAAEYRFLHDDGTIRWVWCSGVPLSDERGQATSYLGNILDITERKAVEAELREAEQRFRLLANSSPVGIFLSDASGGVVYANPRLQAIYGYAEHQLQGLNFAQVFSPEERESARANWLRIAPTDEVHNLERRIISGGGETRWIHVRSVPLTSPSGAVVGRVGSVEDITDRRQAEAQLRRSEERYRLLAEHSTDLISKQAADGTYLYASPACRMLLGYEPEELVGRNSAEFLHPDDRAWMCQSPASLVEPLHVATLSYRMRRKDGSYIWFESTSKVIPEPDRPDGVEVIAVSRDVTARRLAAEQLRSSEALMRAILDTAPDGIITVDEGDRSSCSTPEPSGCSVTGPRKCWASTSGILLPDMYACAATDSLGDRPRSFATRSAASASHRAAQGRHDLRTGAAGRRDDYCRPEHLHGRFTRRQRAASAPRKC